MEKNFHLTAITFLESELSELEAKRANLVAEIDIEIEKRRKLIDGHRELLITDINIGMSMALTQPSEGPVKQTQEPIIPKNAFKNLTIIDGIKKYLNMAQKAKSTREIAEALVKGGKRKALDKYLLDTIRTAIHRRGEKNGIVRIQNLWGLAEWSRKPKAREDGPPNGDSFEEESRPEHSPASEESFSDRARAEGSGADVSPKLLAACDEAGKPLSKTQRIKNVVSLMNGEEVSQPLVIAKVRELCPDLEYIDPTVVTKALRELEADSVLVQLRPRRSQHPAIFRKVK